MGRYKAQRGATNISEAAISSVPQPTPTPDEVATRPRIRDVVEKAGIRLRHYGIAASFVAAVVVPATATVGYLSLIASDQYASTVGFSVRSEEMSSASALLSGLTSLSGTSSSDTDVLYDFIRSQQMVDVVDRQLDLRTIFGRPAFDPVFAFDSDGTIEDLTAYWQRMVKIMYDRSTGLIELRVHAFNPQDARNIAQAIYDESSRMINDLSLAARNDATRFANEELEVASQRLSDARVRVTEYRSENQMVDPAATLQGQMGIINSLQQQLTDALIAQNLLRSSTQSEDDIRIVQGEKRIEVIRALLNGERGKFGVGSSGESVSAADYSRLVGEYERLTVDREFAQQAYLAARTAYDGAVAEAQRTSRYLAAHVEPTLAHSSRYPERFTVSLLVLGFLTVLWGIGVLIFYSVRDRR